MIIAFVNQKGGVGKTTLAINMAGYLSRNNKVLCIDTDPQSSFTKFYREAGSLSFDFTQSFLKDIKYKVEENKQYDYILIDTAGSANPDLLSVVDVFDLIIIPVQPSKIDLDSSLDLLSFVKNKNYKYLINSANHTSISAVKMLQETFKNNNIPYFKSYICNRKIYKDAFLENKTIFDFTNQQAIKELNNLMEEVINDSK